MKFGLCVVENVYKLFSKFVFSIETIIFQNLKMPVLHDYHRYLSKINKDIPKKLST